MNLGELLDELRLNVLRDRSDLINGDDDSLWSDETLLRYIKDAERRFARQTMCIRDATTPKVTQVKLKVGVQTYPIDNSVIGVLSARYNPANGTPYDLQRSGHAIIQQATPSDVATFDPINPFQSQLPPGAPLAYFTDETMVFANQGRVTLSVYPVPSATEDGTVLYLRVLRLPLTDYSMDKLDSLSEIPEDYQLDVLSWAAYRAQRTWDGDAGAPTSAAQHKQAFDEAVQLAVKEMKRKLFAQMPIQYGANGFSWIR